MRALPARILADSLAPPLARWSRMRERQILRHGVPLPPDLADFARGLGIDEPAAIKIERTDRVPPPVPGWLTTLAIKLGLPVFRPSGMTLGRGISAVSMDPALLRHELVHVLQYQQLGGHAAFMHRYVEECLRFGYRAAPLEVEARERSSRRP